MKYGTILFDLDGTLTESGIGIMNSAAWACEKMHYPVPGQDVLRKFVGPPLVYSFREYCGMREDDVVEAVRLYRIDYNETGWKQNRLYDGIQPLLESLKNEGAYLAIASGKLLSQVNRIIKYFGIAPYFDKTSGVDSSASSADKIELIRRALPEAYDPARTVMIGDRKFDMQAAKAFGITAVGALYGYGSREELLETGADIIAETPADLARILLND